MPGWRHCACALRSRARWHHTPVRWVGSARQESFVDKRGLFREQHYAAAALLCHSPPCEWWVLTLYVLHYFVLEAFCILYFTCTLCFRKFFGCNGHLLNFLWNDISALYLTIFITRWALQALILPIPMLIMMGALCTLYIFTGFFGHRFI